VNIDFLIRKQARLNQMLKLPQSKEEPIKIISN
jgi:hypothetical protein